VNIGDWYRTNGESDHLRRLEAALTDDWLTPPKLAQAAGVSPSYAYTALPYLIEERRAQRRKFGHGPNCYRRPQ
jgi:hypothetical protein